jgi:endonuclease-3
MLVATILSSRTLDQTTTAACQKLFRVTRNHSDLKRISLPGLEKLIYPVGFYRVKARQLKALPEALDRMFGGRIPDTADDLVRLPGVGRKTANLVASRAFGKDEICVDAHVHRISNRLGLVRTKRPLETENALKRAVPKKYWRDLNHFLVAFGQTICRPLSPQCKKCPLRQHCRYTNGDLD